MSRKRTFLFLFEGGPFPAFRECKCGQGRGGEIVWHRSPKSFFVCALHGSVQLSHLIQHLDTEKHKHTKKGGVKLDVLGQLRWVILGMVLLGMETGGLPEWGESIFKLGFKRSSLAVEGFWDTSPFIEWGGLGTLSHFVVSFVITIDICHLYTLRIELRTVSHIMPYVIVNKHATLP